MELEMKLKSFLQTPNISHANAIAELQNQVISEENEKGLIPVELSCFVIDDKVDTAKLWPILNNVQAAW